MSLKGRKLGTKFALVATVLNEGKSILPFLESIRGQTLQPAEIVIVDGGSEDDTPEIITDWAKSHKQPVRLVVAPEVNISKGRNIAIEIAKSGIIAVSDGGCVLEPIWCEAITDAIRSGEADVAYGPTRPLFSNAVSRAFAAIKGRRIAFQGGAKPGLFEASPSSRSLAFRKDCGMAVGLYPEWLDIAEDSYFFSELRKKNFRIVYESKAVVLWNMRDSMRSIARQFYKYGWGEVMGGIFLERAILRVVYYLLPLVCFAGLFLGFPAVFAHVFWIWLLPFAVPGWLNIWGSVTGTSPHVAIKTILLVPLVSLTMETTKLAGTYVGFRSRKNLKSVTA